jgi:putative oxygen-independent coproporphyrinogen III oxidase
MNRPAALPPLSLYVHVPWCVRKCPYCDFNSHQQPAELPEDAYITALLDDFDRDSAAVAGRSLQSIFIGGGTPSLFSAGAYARLLSGLAARVRFADDVEITLEANPGTAEQQRFSGYRSAGINRLSIGIQSFDAGQLQTLGRIHGREEGLRAAALAEAAGFDNFNLDLMFGLPGQGLQEALADLQTAIDCGPSHLSWYQLTIEPNTEYFRRPPRLPADDLIADLQEAGMALLEDQGFRRYEISAFSRPGRRARHNLNYWEFGDYLGIGAGAHGKLSARRPDGSLAITRTRKTRMPRQYLAAGGLYLVEQAEVPVDERPFEFMMNALRLAEGVSATLFTERTGLPLPAALIHRLRTEGWLHAATERLCPTPRGLDHLNSLLLQFLGQTATEAGGADTAGQSAGVAAKIMEGLG